MGKHFVKSRTYQIGRLKAGADRTSPTPEWIGTPESYSGDQLINYLGTATFEEYCRVNPHRKGPQTLTCFEVRKGGMRHYFDEGTPLPAGTINPQTTNPTPQPFGMSGLDGPPPIYPGVYPVNGGTPTPSIDLEFLYRRIERLEQDNAAKDQIIYSLQSQLLAAREQAAESRKAYEASEMFRQLQQRTHETESRIRTQIASQQRSGLDGLEQLAAVVAPFIANIFDKGKSGTEISSAAEQAPPATLGHIGRRPTRPAPSDPYDGIRYDAVEEIQP